MPSLPIVPLAVFMALLLAIAMFALTAAGHFPAEHRGAQLKAWPGRVILWASIAVVAASAALAIAFTNARLPWPAAIIGGGAALLVAPLALQRFPDSFVNGRRGLALLAAVAGALACAATWLPV